MNLRSVRLACLAVAGCATAASAQEFPRFTFGGYGTAGAVYSDEEHADYQVDQFSFANATLRCVGVGKCRREDGGTMCPSYMATHEEMHSTRGRARLLFEMLKGNPLRNGWKNEAVKEALERQKA